MHYDEFVIRVQHEAGLDTPEEAVQAIRATLETLGERLDNPEKAQLASELPKELRAFLEQHPNTQVFGLEEFYHRVSARAGVRRGRAEALAQAVMRVLAEAVSAGELADVRLRLAPEFDPLFSPAQGAPGG